MPPCLCYSLDGREPEGALEVEVEEQVLSSLVEGGCHRWILLFPRNCKQSP